MPRRASRASQGPVRPARGSPRTQAPGSTRPGGAGIEVALDPLTGLPAEVRRVQPYQAVKNYRCPGCNQDLAPGTGHVVVVPQGSPEDRRHWHRGCWQRASKHG